MDVVAHSSVLLVGTAREARGRPGGFEGRDIDPVVDGAHELGAPEDPGQSGGRDGGEGIVDGVEGGLAAQEEAGGVEALGPVVVPSQRVELAVEVGPARREIGRASCRERV